MVWACYKRNKIIIKIGGFKVKSKGKLKMALMILICIVVMLVGFVGIYTKNKNKYANKIPNYQL